MSIFKRIAVIAAGLGFSALAACAGPAPGGPGFSASASPAPADLPPLLNVDSGARAAHPLVGRIWSPAEGRNVSESEFARHVVNSRYVLIGEKHDNPGHHRLQAGILAELVRAGRRPAVAWEMIDFSKSRALAAYLDGGGGAAGLGAALDWQESGWPDWSDYQPIAEVAMRADLQQYPANFDHTTIGRLAQEGLSALPNPMILALLRGARWTADDEAALNLDLVESHCGVMPAGMLAPMNRIQRSRDAAMAAVLLEVDRGDGAVLIAGDGHVRADRGVPVYLGSAPDAVSIGLIEAQPGETDPAAYLDNARQFDFVIFTEKVDSPDRCKGFRLKRK